MELIWIALCKECGEIDKMPNGVYAECIAKKHKQDNPEHKVYLATEML